MKNYERHHKKKKILTFCFSLPIATIILFIFSVQGDSILASAPFIGVLIIFLAPVFLLYGIPVSLLSDKITKNMRGVYAWLIAMLIHLFFGLIFPYFYALIFDTSSIGLNFSEFFRVYSIFFKFGAIASLIFWLADEVISSYLKHES